MWELPQPWLKGRQHKQKMYKKNPEFIQIQTKIKVTD